MGSLDRLEDVIEHPARRLLNETIEANPGLSMQDLQKRCDIKYRSVLAYHLHTLEKAGYVNPSREGRFTKYYPCTDYSELLSRRPHVSFQEPG